MSATLLFTLFAIYFGMLMLVTTLAGRKARSNEAFFLGNRQSPWWVVSIGMVGSSISGVSFISVPGMVGGIGFTYMQTVVGFFFGYIVVAKLLLPLYYKFFTIIHLDYFIYFFKMITIKESSTSFICF